MFRSDVWRVKYLPSLKQPLCLQPVIEWLGRVSSVKANDLLKEVIGLWGNSALKCCMLGEKPVSSLNRLFNLRKKTAKSISSNLSNSAMRIRKRFGIWHGDMRSVLPKAIWSVNRLFQSLGTIAAFNSLLRKCVLMISYGRNKHDGNPETPSLIPLYWYLSDGGDLNTEGTYQIFKSN